MRVFVQDLFTEGCGRVEPNTSLLVANHVRPHKGDRAVFRSERNAQTLCKTCHDRDKQPEEGGRF